MMKTLSVAAVAAVLICLATGPAWSQSFENSQEGFEKFISQMAEMDKKSQLKLTNETLTEFYDRNCREEKRQVKRDSATAKWADILPGRAKRNKEKLSFHVQELNNGQGVVYLSKNETWLYGHLYFKWEDQAKGWRMTGFKFDLAEPGDCL